MSDRVMKGTKHESDWYFYPNSSSLMTAVNTQKQMDDTEVLGNNFIKKQLTPQNYLNMNMNYHNQSVVNSPEFMLCLTYR